MRQFINRHSICIMECNNVFVAMISDQYGRTIRQRTCYSMEDAKRVFNLFCMDVKAM